MDHPLSPAYHLSPMTWLLIAVVSVLCASTVAESVTRPEAVSVEHALLPGEPSIIHLDDIGIYAIGYAFRGQEEKLLPTGWSGQFAPEVGIALREMGVQKGKRALLLHCPWIGGTGIAFQEFTFHLPKTRRILLRGATAMSSEILTKSDGATFRVFVNGKRLLDVNRTDDIWQPFEFDLTSLGGQTALIRFETDPGPKDNPGWDFSLWGDRELVLEGYKAKPASHPEPPPLKLANLCSSQSGTIAPPSGFNGKTSMSMHGDTAILRYEGLDGTLEYHWQLPRPDDPFFGKITLLAQQKGSARFEVPLATTAHLEWDAPAQQKQARWETRGDRVECLRAFQVGGEQATIAVTGSLSGKSLVLEVAAVRPFTNAGPSPNGTAHLRSDLVRLLDAGNWGPALLRRQVPVPYYSGSVYYLPAENLFVNCLSDWTDSSSSGHDGMVAQYQSLTDGSRNLLHERAVFTAAWHLAEVLPNIPNAPSPFRKQVANRIVLDIWGGGFTDIAKHFEELSDYGIDRCTALIHAWQRSGYDNALPMHYPAIASLGGDEGMKQLVETGTRLGYLVALHENYVDYYPNYDLFNEQDIAVDSAGKRINGWFNPGTMIQSLAEKPNAILRLAESQSPEIHRRYGTNACYLDVHSAVPPWFHVDFRSGEEGAGTFHRVWDVHRQLWQYERRTHGGPVFGEGNNHWYWSGELDGVEAQFGSGWPWAQGLSAPLAVDFDLLKIHPLQFNHGMGYYERWWDTAKWGAVPPMVVLDQYRMQEVAYGHAGFLAGTTWSVLPLAWLEHHLLSPVMARYATANPTDIRYHVNGRWIDSTHAAKENKWDQLRVRYDNGLTITANNSQDALQVGSHKLLRFGWLAEGAGVTAYTALQDGVVADYAETSDMVFANARPAADWQLTGLKQIRPQVASFQQAQPHAFKVTYQWQVQQKLSSDYLCFVHFADVNSEAGGITFQQDHPLAIPTSRWQSGQSVVDGPYTIQIPATLPDGDYAWFIGLHTPQAGRLSLLGIDDGTARIRLGVLHIRRDGEEIEFEPERGTGEERTKLYQQHVNQASKVLDFDAVRTDGSVFIRREGNDWVLRTLPRDRAFLVELSTRRFSIPARIRCIGGKDGLVTPKKRGAWWWIPLNGAKQYRWPYRAAPQKTQGRSSHTK